MNRILGYTRVAWRRSLTLLALGAALTASAEDTARQSDSSGAATSGNRSDPRSYQTQTRDLGISPNEPVYFSLGLRERVHAKFQISLKFRPFGPTDDSVPGRRVWNDMYLGFTQTSLWDLESDSKPFYDSAYRPSIFYHRRDIGTLLGGRLGLRGGYEHESNGKSGAESRSIDTLFLRPSWWWDIDERWAVAFSPKLVAYIEKSENPDIARYRGHVDWGLSLAQDKGVRLSATLRTGSNGRVSTLVDFSYPFQDITPLRSLGLVHGYLHIQYFEGYGETILAYNQRLPWQWRVGLMIVR